MTDPCLLLSRRLLFGGRAPALLWHIRQLQPVHTTGGKCDRPRHRTVRGVHVPAGQSGTCPKTKLFVLWHEDGIKCEGLRNWSLCRFVDFEQQSFRESDNHHLRHLRWACLFKPLVYHPEETGRRAASLAKTRWEMSAAWVPLGFGSLNHCHFRWAAVDLAAGFAGACWRQTGGADRRLSRSALTGPEWVTLIKQKGWCWTGRTAHLQNEQR